VLHAERSVLPAEAGRASELLQAQLDRFEELLFDLLEISRHDAGAAVLEVEHVELGALVRRVVAAYEPLAAARGIEIHTRLPDEPIVVEADPRRVDRILRNLLSNAVEYGAEQPVEVQLAAADGAAAVVVADRGIGLRPGEASLVFNRFWRSDPSRARTTGGTGLGLSIALQDARLHGGWLQAWGEPGRGSRFRLTLPLQARDVVDGSPLPLALDETASTSGEPIG
jgi:two-component system sensor histidine kinase MtrB